VGTTYADLGAVVTDDHDNNLGVHTFIGGTEVQTVSLDTSSSTVYTIFYRATDTDGNTSEEHRVVVVGDGGLTTAATSTDTQAATSSSYTDTTSTQTATLSTDPTPSSDTTSVSTDTTATTSPTATDIPIPTSTEPIITN
jgi:hypothetical protein